MRIISIAQTVQRNIFADKTQKSNNNRRSQENNYLFFKLGCIHKQIECSLLQHGCAYLLCSQVKFAIFDIFHLKFRIYRALLQLLNSYKELR